MGAAAGTAAGAAGMGGGAAPPDDDDAWLGIAQRRAALFPSFLIGPHAKLLRWTGSGDGTHGRVGKLCVLAAVLVTGAILLTSALTIISALFLGRSTILLPSVGCSVLPVLSWKLVRCRFARARLRCCLAA